MHWVLTAGKYICRDAKTFGLVLKDISVWDWRIDEMFISY